MAEVISVNQSSEQTNTMAEQINNMAVAVTNQNPLPTNVSENEADKKAPQNVPEEFMHKSRLQQFTQRSSLGLPVYHTINEGFPHAPQFRSTVLVDGIWYTSPNTFSHLKAAEQDAAQVALSGVKEKTKHEGCPLIREDTVFCKSILNEYAAKMNIEKPTYQTVQHGGLIPSFKSTVVFNSIHYMGETGKNKKEAEQLAARAAVMSILETDSGTVMLEIIKSKRKLYAALDKVQDTGNSNAGFIPMGLAPPIHVGKRKEVEVIDNADHKTNTGLLAYSLGQPSDVQAPNQLHVFKKPKSGSSSVEVASPIVFVPPVVDPSLLCSTSAKKRRRNKKKVQQNMQVDPQVPGAMQSSTQVPPCSVAQ